MRIDEEDEKKDKKNLAAETMENRRKLMWNQPFEFERMDTKSKVRCFSVF